MSVKVSKVGRLTRLKPSGTGVAHDVHAPARASSSVSAGTFNAPRTAAQEIEILNGKAAVSLNPSLWKETKSSETGLHLRKKQMSKELGGWRRLGIVLAIAWTLGVWGYVWMNEWPDLDRLQVQANVESRGYDGCSYLQCMGAVPITTGASHPSRSGAVAAADICRRHSRVCESVGISRIWAVYRRLGSYTEDTDCELAKCSSRNLPALRDNSCVGG